MGALIINSIFYSIAFSALAVLAGLRIARAPQYAPAVVRCRA